MLYKFVAAAAVATAIVGGWSVSQAQNDPRLEEDIRRSFSLCYLPPPTRQFDCVRFGVLIGQHTDKWPEWRQTNPEWFDWETGKLPPPQ
jgi:hypothetical protein